MSVPFMAQYSCYSFFHFQTPNNNRLIYLAGENSTQHLTKIDVEKAALTCKAISQAEDKSLPMN